MSSERNSQIFTKENLDGYLFELAKAYKKLGGKAMPAEIILVGGAAVLAGYSFRELTTDIDAVIQAATIIKDAIISVGDKHQLPYGWLNTDFTKTASYTHKLIAHARPYKSFAGVLHVRKLEGEYLIAMKLVSGRQYKHDKSDIAGILEEHAQRGNPITFQQINDAVINLYGGWEKISDFSREYLENTLRDGDYRKIYESTVQSEESSKNNLMEFEAEYPGVLNEGNINQIIRDLEKKTSEEKTSILKRLHSDSPQKKDSPVKQERRRKSEPEL